MYKILRAPDYLEHKARSKPLLLYTILHANTSQQQLLSRREARIMATNFRMPYTARPDRHQPLKTTPEIFLRHMHVDSPPQITALQMSTSGHNSPKVLFLQHTSFGQLTVDPTDLASQQREANLAKLAGRSVPYFTANRSQSCQRSGSITQGDCSKP